jgi:hypothetical protein
MVLIGLNTTYRNHERPIFKYWNVYVTFCHISWLLRAIEPVS